MNVLIAGATGAIGREVASLLLKNGDQVYAVTRSKTPPDDMLKSGVRFTTADVLDAESINQAVKSIKPDAMVNMLTALPKYYTPKAMEDAAEFNDYLRINGGKNLQDAALANGVRRIVIQSACFWYEKGGGLADEKTPLAFEGSPGVAAGCKTYQFLENSLLNEASIEASVMRFGFFYGPGTWYEKGQSMAEQFLKKEYAVVGKGDAIWNFVHIEDAAKGIALALKGAPGIYNISDDNPTSQSIWVPAYAKYLKVDTPLTMSYEECLNTQGEEALYYAKDLRGASNAKSKRDLGFKPRPLEWL